MLEKKDTLFNKAYLAIFIANLFQMMGQQTMNALVPKFARSLGANAEIVGIVSGIFAISAIAIRPVASPAFDCFSKKRLLQCALTVIGLSYIVYFLAPSVPFIIAGRLFQGIGIGCSAPLCLSLACESTPEKLLARGVSIFSLGQAFGQAVGPSVGLFLSENIGYRYTFAVAFVMIAISLAVLTVFFKGGVKPEGKTYKIRLNTVVTKEAIPAAGINMIVAMSYACINGFLPIYGGLLDIQNVGLYFTVYAVGLLIFRPLTSGLVDKYGAVKILLPGFVFYACTFICFSVSKSIVTIIIAAVFASLGYGIVQPTIQAIGMRAVPKEKRGVGSNTLFLGQDIGQFAGPWLAGIIIDGVIDGGATEVSAYSTGFLCLVAPIVLDIIIVLLLRKKIK